MAIPGKLRECNGCPLYVKGEGFSAGELVQDSIITLIGEALGEVEAAAGLPFVGPAGEQLDRALQKVGLYRGSVTIGNAISCRPPNNWLHGAPWEIAALNHCRVHRQNIYKPTTRVYVTLGAVATRTVLSDFGYPYEGKLENWHSTVIQLDENQYLIPTFHPSYLLQGNQKLFNAQCFALRLAMEIAAFGWAPPRIETHVDPPPDVFERNFMLEMDHNRGDAWLAVDIETGGSLGEDEGEYARTGLEDITRVNFSLNVLEGWTVPWDNRYIPLIEKILRSDFVKVFWNERFDVPILRKNGMVINGVVVDAMQGWHMLQPNLPMGLGFVAPFYCKIGPWKHLSSSAPGRYAALDAAATLQCAYGIAKDLVDEGRWESFERYMTKFDEKVLHPAEDIGLLIDPDAVQSLQDSLQKELTEVEERIQSQIPADLLPLEGGWKRDPGDKWPGAFKKRVEQVTTCCIECGETDVTTRHECSE